MNFNFSQKQKKFKITSYLLLSLFVLSSLLISRGDSVLLAASNSQRLDIPSLNFFEKIELFFYNNVSSLVGTFLTSQTKNNPDTLSQSASVVTSNPISINESSSSNVGGPLAQSSDNFVGSNQPSNNVSSPTVAPIKVSDSVSTPTPVRIIERVVASDLSKDYFESRIQELTNQFNSQLSELTSGGDGPLTNIYQQIANSQRIDQITNTTINSPTISGGTLSNVTINSIVTTSSTASSTFANGIDLSGGCFSISGTCITGGINGSSTPGGSNTQIQYNSAGSFAGSANFVWDNTNSRLGIGTSSPYQALSVAGNVVADSFIATTTATSTLVGGLSTNLLNVTSSTATSSFANGIDLTSGCFSIGNTCLSAGTGSPGGLTTQVQYNNGGTFAGSSNFVWDNTNAKLGLGATSTMFAQLSVNSTAGVPAFVVGSSTVTSLAVASNGNVGVGTAAPGATARLVVRGLGTTAASGSAASFTDSQGNSLLYIQNNGNIGLGTTSPYQRLSVAGNVVADTFIATSTATSSFAGGFSTNLLSVTSSTASSTFANGINLTSGCFSINGSCVTGGGGGSGTPGGSDTQIQFNSAGSFAGSSNFTWDNTNVKLAIGATTTPFASLSINSVAGVPAFVIGSSTATTFLVDSSGKVGVGVPSIGANSSRFVVRGTSAVASGSAFNVQDSGGNALLFVRNDGNVGLGTTSPYQRLSVAGNVVADSFIATTTATSSFAGGLNLSSGCFSIQNTCLSAGTGSPGGLTTQVQFNNGGTFGGSSNFTWDIGNNLLGIGTSTPSAQVAIQSIAGQTAFAVGSSSGETFMIDGNGRVGIGTNNPSSAGAVRLLIRGTTATQNSATIFLTDVSGNPIFIARDNGNIGIGTTSPYQRLSVAGNVVADTFIATSTATSSFAGGINLSGGCFSIQNTCLSAGTGSPGGLTTQVQYNNGGTFAGSSNFVWDNTNGFLGIGTSTPQRRLWVTNNGANGQIGLEDTGANTNQHYATIGLSRGSISFNTLADDFSSTTRMSIDSTGNIGIGTSSPNTKLHLAGSNPTITITDITNNVGTILKSGTTFGVVGTNNAFPMLFIAGGSTVMTALATNGNIGIGTTSPYQKLSVAGNVVADTFIATSTATSSFAGGINLSGGCFSIQNTCLSAGTGSPGGLTTQVQFNNGGTFGGSSNFTWDNTNNLLSIGATTTPYGTLSINSVAGVPAFVIGSSTATTFLVDSSGKVGVGVPSIGANSSRFVVRGTSATAGASAFNVQDSGGNGLLLVRNDGNVGVGTTSPYQKLSVAGNVVADSFIATTTATSTLVGGLSTNLLNVTSSTASSTFANGINLTSGCFSIGNTCLSAGSGSPGGSNTQVQFNNGGTFAGSSNFVWDNTNNLLGIGTSTPFGQLSVNANAGQTSFVVGSSTGTSFIIDPTGLIGVGVANPASVGARLTVRGFGSTNGASFALTDNAGNVNLIERDNGTLGLAGTTTPFAALSINAVAGQSSFAIGSSSVTTFLIDKNGALTMNTPIGTNILRTAGTVTPRVLVGSGTDDGTNNFQLFGTMYVKNNVGLGTTSPYQRLSVAGNVVADSFIATTTATSTLVGGLSTNLLNVTSSTASSTFANGINLTSGCFSIGNTCLSAGSGSPGGSNTQVQFNNGGTFAGSSNFVWDNTNAKLGLGATSTMFAQLSVNSTAGVPAFVVGSSTGTSFVVDKSGNVGIGTTTTSNTALYIDRPSGYAGDFINLYNESAFVGSVFKVDNAGNTNVQTLQSTGAVVSFGGNSSFAGNVGVGTTSPYQKLSVAGNVVADSFIATTTATSTLVGGLSTNLLNVTSSTASSTFANGINLTSGCFSIGNTCLSAGSGSPGGSNTQVQFNNGGTFAGSSNFVWDNTNAKLGLGATSTMFAQLSVNSTAGVPAFVVGSSTVTSLAVASNGNVGVGTAAPGATARLVVRGLGTTAASGSAASFTDSSGNSLLYIQNNGQVGVGTTTPFAFLSVNAAAGGPAFTVGSSSAQLFIVDKLGNVGVGTTTPWRKFAVTGTMSVSGLSATASGDSAVCISANNEITFNSGVSNCTVSSIRFKHDVATSTQGLDLVRQMRPVTFEYNGSTDQQFGFIAEEVDLLEPRLVARNADGQPQSVRYDEFTSVLAKAIQDLDGKVTSIDTRLTNLEAIVASSTQQTNSLSFSQILSQLTNMGISFTDNLVSLKNVVVEKLTVGSSAKPTGITLYDEVTGSPYCLKIRNGATVSLAGECDSLTNATSTVSNTASSTPVDTSAPIITVVGNNPATVTVGSTYADLGATVTDTDGQGNINNNLGLHFTVDGVDVSTISIDTGTTSTHTIVYSAIDGAGNTGYATRTVDVLAQ